MLPPKFEPGEAGETEEPIEEEEEKDDLEILHRLRRNRSDFQTAVEFRTMGQNGRGGCGVDAAFHVLSSHDE